MYSVLFTSLLLLSVYDVVDSLFDRSIHFIPSLYLPAGTTLN